VNGNSKVEVGLRQEGTLGFLDFPRDVTAQTREAAYSAYNNLARAKVKAVGFNFVSTDYMNSAGIGLIISLVEDALQAGRKVFAYGLISHYRKLFNMVGLTERLALVANEAEVKQRVAPPAPPPPEPKPVEAESKPPEVVKPPQAPEAVIPKPKAPSESAAS
jgi:anti-anti-sigma regulatory factor